MRMNSHISWWSPTGEGQTILARDRAAVRIMHRAGFTLVELIVVMVILGILAAAVVPRMLNMGERQAEVEAKAVQQLLSIAAQKSDVWNQPVAVELSKEDQLTVFTRRSDAKTADDASGAAAAKWQPDGLVEPVTLSKLKIATAMQDGVVLPSAKWRVTFIPGQPRPVISINLDPKAEGDGPRWTVSLAADDPVARRAKAADAASNGMKVGSQTRTIDLDDAGKGQTPW